MDVYQHSVTMLDAFNIVLVVSLLRCEFSHGNGLTFYRIRWHSVSRGDDVHILGICSDWEFAGLCYGRTPCTDVRQERDLTLHTPGGILSQQHDDISPRLVIFPTARWDVLEEECASSHSSCATRSQLRQEALNFEAFFRGISRRRVDIINAYKIYPMLLPVHALLLQDTANGPRILSDLASRKDRVSDKGLVAPVQHLPQYGHFCPTLSITFCMRCIRFLYSCSFWMCLFLGLLHTGKWLPCRSEAVQDQTFGCWHIQKTTLTEYETIMMQFYSWGDFRIRPFDCAVISMSVDQIGIA